MTKAVRVMNNSVVDCAFSWSFLEDVEEGKLVATARRPYIPVNQVRRQERISKTLRVWTANYVAWEP